MRVQKKGVLSAVYIKSLKNVRNYSYICGANGGEIV